ncbi:Crp/Fnr family transcriptional regulator [Algoriphagus aestuariicola]|uniref:Crp/Fnr family transcriptional regulator n=1 Tax=Algoriphagus aestuariicola TaxID=1852016 RepID=A0ABS3BRG2_9BACT|nr:Crp/Fnr family transcriptional regulator [Algoriphagus aestuariicola]MBN7801864.1 Crp/Fnr family transcriptional regulator [Algoriphagus aestuariicola]
MNYPLTLGQTKSFPSLTILQKGESVFLQNQEFKGYFLIRTGMVKICRIHESGAKALLSFKIQGEFLGEITETPTGKRQSYTAVATEDRTIVELIPYSIGTPCKLQEILKNLQEEIHQTRIRLERYLYQDAEERIKTTLKDLATRLGKKYGSETLLKLPMTHEDLATLTYTSRQTVTTVLSALKAQNKITYSRGRILIRNIDKL